ncbi:aminotransferase class V-fold PLP-dependent enzyme [Caulobacter sp. 17J80-11]|uniref:aminotransferase class V-fold PLP-dependent enzyme n=1 Tax=Caulobacter sp. 17J80-11 TaxID=2763502 RepID=UPI0016539110|nr:aminotransferase class V-fold PLP-dependent enzyme [Caulobacter sp. 17J80-11]MBC6982984.1 aminotransferase class V-fold PLP-dependent enzyme [Caulobacter sp. 17J80-11]
MSYKRLFSRALSAAPGRLHVAAHSHHLWPDASREAQIQAWEDAAVLADNKWDKVFGEVYPGAQAHVARELNLPSPQTVLFAPNTHELMVRLLSAFDKRPVRALSTDGEFHSFRRQSARWIEAGELILDVVPTEPFEDFEEAFLTKARCGAYDLIFTSHVFFKTGRVFERVFELAELARPDGPWVVVDGYHGFRAVPTDLSSVADRLFYVAGGYKYAMAGEGAAFLHAPAGFGERPTVTGWYAEFADLIAPPGGVGYGRDASRFLGATFDPSGLYRFGAVADMLDAEGLTTADVSAHVRVLQDQLVAAVRAGQAGRLSEAEILNPPGNHAQARFIAFRHPEAQAWKKALMARDVITDVRDDVLRVGLGLYHDPEDIERFCAIARETLA